METLLIVISVILIVLVLLQSNKASDSSGGNAVLLGKTKERGLERIITMITYGLGFAFILVSFILSI